MADDYRTLLADAIGSVTTVADVYLSGTVTKFPHHMSGKEAAVTADLVLGLHVPWMCPTCHGPGELFTSPAGERTRVWPDDATCVHADAPTIGDLLRWGEAAWGAWVKERTHESVYYSIESVVLRSEADQ